jgi:polar amino acid transport system substrate-binding protein
MSDVIRSQLAPTGKLRAAINLGNFLLVTGKSPNGDPEGVSPDMAAEVARRIGVSVSTLYKYLPAARATITHKEPA